MLRSTIFYKQNITGFCNRARRNVPAVDPPLRCGVTWLRSGIVPWLGLWTQKYKLLKEDQNPKPYRGPLNTRVRRGAF